MGNLQQQKKENIEFNPNLLTTTVQNSLAFPGSVVQLGLGFKLITKLTFNTI